VYHLRRSSRRLKEDSKELKLIRILEITNFPEWDELKEEQKKNLKSYFGCSVEDNEIRFVTRDMQIWISLNDLLSMIENEWRKAYSKEVEKLSRWENCSNVVSFFLGIALIVSVFVAAVAVERLYAIFSASFLGVLWIVMQLIRRRINHQEENLYSLNSLVKSLRGMNYETSTIANALAKYSKKRIETKDIVS
jgi:hypothetical protein